MANSPLKKCSACGEMMELGAAFCTNCGNRLEATANVKKCSSCGEAMEKDAAFCTNCGNRVEEKKAKSLTGPSSIGKQLLALSNDFLSVREINPERFEFSSQTGTQSPVQKIKINYDAVAQLEPEKKLLTFWEMMVESSAGMDAGFHGEKTIQKGIEVGKKIHGQVLFGGKYGFEYGKLREVIKAIAREEGWEFKTSVFKPKTAVDAASKGTGKTIPVKKILVPVLALLLIAVIGAIGYKIFTSRSSSPVKASTSKSTLASSFLQTKFKGVDPQSSDRKEFKKNGTVNDGKPFVETDKDTYNHGEKIKVHFYNAPGYSRDWLCIVPAGAKHTEPGNYQYIPKRGRGILTFKSPRPGKYEARAYYNYSSFDYKISARYVFTVHPKSN